MKHIPQPEGLAPVMKVYGSIEKHIVVPQRRPWVPLIHSLIHQ